MVEATQEGPFNSVSTPEYLAGKMDTDADRERCAVFNLVIDELTKLKGECWVERDGRGECEACCTRNTDIELVRFLAGVHRNTNVYKAPDTLRD